MSNKTTVFILAWMCLICSFFTSFGVLLICSSIFFSVGYIIEEMNIKSVLDLKAFYVLYNDSILIEHSTIVLALDYNSAVVKFKKEFKGNYYKIKSITEKNK